jgi:sarcosine oxidase subunit beta
MSSEPLKPFLDPLVVDLSDGLYFSQSTRGEIVAGISMPGHHAAGDDIAIDMDSSFGFLRSLAKALTRLMPICRSLAVLRQWSGPYDVSPDGDAIVGPTPGFPRLLQVCGFTGHGFMMAPAVGKLLARFIALHEPHPMLERWSPARFRDGTGQRREDMIIG